MLSSVRTALSRTIRQISKTSTGNRHAIPRQQKAELTINKSPRKWTKLNKCDSRALSTIESKTSPETANASLVTKDEVGEFMAVFPGIVRDLTDTGGQTDIPEVTQKYMELLRYVVFNGKKTRGLMVVAAYKMLQKEGKITPENVRLANIMGWCMEMLHGFLVVLDDIMDRSETRRGVPCWYRREGVGLNAINDAVMLEQDVYTLLKKHFSKHQCYVPTLELLHDVTLKTAMGQSLDCSSSKEGKPNFEQFTMNKYNSLIKYKTAYYTFALPVALGMYMANLYDPELRRQAENIFVGIGRFAQIENDFLDCFGNSTITGKDGNDIREGKCTWLAVMALQRANPAQRNIMETYYGRPDNEAISIIQDLYEELDLRKTYAIFKEESFNMTRTHIQQLSKGLPHELFFKILERIYGREC